MPIPMVCKIHYGVAHFYTFGTTWIICQNNECFYFLPFIVDILYQLAPMVLLEKHVATSSSCFSLYRSLCWKKCNIFTHKKGLAFRINSQLMKHVYFHSNKQWVIFHVYWIFAKQLRPLFFFSSSVWSISIEKTILCYMLF